MPTAIPFSEQFFQEFSVTKYAHFLQKGQGDSAIYS